MVALVALVSFAAGIAGGIALVRHIDAGDTWEDWVAAELGPFWSVFQYVFPVVLLAAFYGFGLPAALRAAVLGAGFGTCAVFFTHGIRLRRRSPRPDPARIPDVGWWGRRLGRDLPQDVRPREFPPSLGWIVGGPLLGVVLGLILGARGSELIATGGLGLWVVLVQGFAAQTQASGELRRDPDTWEDRPPELL